MNGNIDYNTIRGSMKQLVKLLNQANPLKGYASELQSAMTQVALVCDLHEDGTNIFPAKKEVIETMANAIQKMCEVSDILLSIKCNLQPQNGGELS